MSVSEQPPKDQRFTVDEKDGSHVYDEDFGYDAALYITGDFIGEHRRRYAEAVAAALNAMPPPVAPKDYGDE